MAWSAPISYALGHRLTAANMNAHKDQLNETAPAKATAAGELFYATGANAIAALTLGAEGELFRAGAAAPEWEAPLGTTPSDLTSDTDDNKIPNWGAIRGAFVPTDDVKYQYFTSSTTFAWPWNTDRGVAMLVGGSSGSGGGGGGGGGGGYNLTYNARNGSNGGNGAAGSAGGVSQILSGGASLGSASGGSSAPGGKGGQGGWRINPSYTSTEHGYDSGDAGSGGAGGTGGAGGAGGSYAGDGGDGGNGASSNIGATVYRSLSGMTMSAEMTVTVGAGGSGGAGGTGGSGGFAQSGGIDGSAGSAGSSGSGGSRGWVLIVPVY